MIDYLLRSSLEQGKVITIIYTKENIITKRNIRVLEMGEATIKAYCFLRHQNRIFKRSSILAAGFCRERLPA